MTTPPIERLADEETGFYYLQSRYYNPELGRFISADVYLSTGQGVLGHNAYAYCLNNPINLHDELGYYPSRYSEDDPWALNPHSKKGTTNPSNKAKHERGLSRKERDKLKKEKGDERRKQRNGRRSRPEQNQYSIPSYEYQKETSIILATGCALILVVLIFDDLLGGGVADDVAIPVVITELLSALGF